MNAKQKRVKKWKLFLTIFTFVALGVMIFAIREQLGQVVDNLGKANTFALLLMIPMQVLNYHSQSGLYRSLLAILGEKIEYKKMIKIALELNFVNNVFPSGGVSSFSYFGLRMRKEGISGGKATLVQMMKFAMVFISFQILLFIGLFCLAIVGKTSNLTILVAASLGTFLLVGTLGVSFIISSEQRITSFFGYITRTINKLIHIVRPHYPETINVHKVEKMFIELHENYLILKSNYRELLKPLVYALGANATEILTIYSVYIAFGNYVNIGAVIIAYAVANFAGIVSVLPGGVGIYEALMTGVLITAGVPASVSIPVTVMYRVLNMLIQLPAGYYFYHKTLHGNESEQEK